MNDNGLRSCFGILIVILAFGFMTCEEASLLQDLSNDAGGAASSGDPIPGGAGVISVAYTYFDDFPPIFAANVTWEAATDSATPQAQLLYQAYIHDDGIIDSVADAEAHGSPILSTPEAGATSAYLNFLSQNSTYYFNVVVTDEDDHSVAYGMISAETGNGPVLELTDITADPDQTISEGGTLDFGTVSDSAYPSAASPATRTVRIANTGDRVLTISAITYSGSWDNTSPFDSANYFVDPAPGMPLAVDPGDWRDVAINIWSDWNTGPATGGMSLDSDCANINGVFSFNLTAQLESF